jgi:hypothetical protein
MTSSIISFVVYRRTLRAINFLSFPLNGTCSYCTYNPVHKQEQDYWRLCQNSQTTSILSRERAVMHPRAVDIGRGHCL